MDFLHSTTLRVLVALLLQALFEQHDPEATGVVTVPQFRACLRSADISAGPELSGLAADLLRASGAGPAHAGAQVDGTKSTKHMKSVINYIDFVAAVIDSSTLGEHPGALASSFSLLDVDGDGAITCGDIVAATHGRVGAAAARRIVREALESAAIATASHSTSTTMMSRLPSSSELSSEASWRPLQHRGTGSSGPSLPDSFGSARVTCCQHDNCGQDTTQCSSDAPGSTTWNAYSGAALNSAMEQDTHMQGVYFETFKHIVSA